MYFIIVPDCARIFPSGVTMYGIWPRGGLPAETEKEQYVGVSSKERSMAALVVLNPGGGEEGGTFNEVL